MSRNPKYTRLMSTTRWLRLRAEKLKKQPVCERCERGGKTALAQEIHHIIPLERARTDGEMERLCFNFDNLMAVCRDCHRAIHTEMFSHSRAAIKANRARETQRFRARYLDVATDADDNA